MTKASPSRTTFEAGLWSKRARARTDSQRYTQAMEELTNYVITPTGALLRRPGTKFSAKPRDTDPVKLVGFKSTPGNSYVVEFGKTKLRFFQSHALVTDTHSTITNVTQANPAVVTTSAVHGLANGQRILITGVVGMTELNGLEFIVAGVTGTTLQLSGINSTGYHAYTSGGGTDRILEVASPAVSLDPFDFDFLQSSDALYITHSAVYPQRLQHTGALAWTLQDYTLSDGPYLAENTATTDTLTCSAATGSVTVTASSGLFAATDVGRLIRIFGGTTWAWLKITAYTDSTHVTATVGPEGGAPTTAKFRWRLGLYCTALGFPSAATFHQGRLVFSGHPTYPERIDASQPGDFRNFAPTAKDTTGALTDAVSDSCAYSFQAATSDSQQVLWMVSAERLIMGTTAGEQVFAASSQNEAITPSSVNASQPTAWGSSDVQPVRMGGSILHVQGDTRTLREVQSKDTTLHSTDITLLASNLTTAGIKQLAAQTAPFPIVWAALADGALVALNFSRDPEQVVAGWHQHRLGGQVDADGNAPAVESIAVIPNGAGTYSELWLLVRRWVGGATVRHIELLSKYDREDIDPEDCYYVDCGLSYSGAPASTLTGLPHLNGETVRVVGDGWVQADQVVSAGTVTLQYAASTVHLGLGYSSKGKPTAFQEGTTRGGALGKKSRVHKATILFDRAMGVKVGPSLTQLRPWVMRKESALEGVATPLFSGELTKEIDPSTDHRATIAWQQDDPYPGTILAVQVELELQEGG